ncbi:serine hydrolase domain-containing protein [Kitasatospora sp. NPDC001547]|uniref:serine hydrolase domain-containing protein n=1 Tax=Kitasatospora sp. NPDC001547 TaxID=3364015 RepID=UPI0036ADDFC5
MAISTTLSEVVGSAVRPGDPGLSVGVYTDGKLIHQASAGLASVEFQAPVDTRTRFDIASVSKQFTAAAVLLLCREGRLSLDDDIRTHLPELKLAVPVTVGQCLRHTGGLRDWLALTAIAGRPLTRITQDQTLAFVAGLSEVDFEPGTAFSYSNTGYVLAASLVRRLTGRTLGEFTTDRMFAPLGMNDTVFREDSREPLPRFAYGYDVTRAGVRRADTEESAVGDGGLATSVADLAPWFGFLQDGRVLGADIRDGLLRRADTGDGQEWPYALGLYHTTIAGHPAFGHAGGVPGYRSQLLFMPDTGLGVALLGNNSSIDAAKLATRVLRLAAGLPEDDPVELTAGPAAARPAARLAGDWLDPRSDLTLRIEAVGDGRIRVHGAPCAGEFAPAVDGSWQGLQDSAGFWLRASPDTVTIGSVYRPGRATQYRRCAPATAGATLPPAVYRSAELGILATVTRDGTLELGLEFVGTIEPAPDGAFRAGGGISLRPSGDDLLISTQGVHRLRFVRQPDDTAPLGLPPGLKPAS